MAKVTAQVVGGQAKVIEVSTVDEVRAALGLSASYEATVNGEPADMEQELEDYEFVTFSEKVKGGGV